MHWGIDILELTMTRYAAARSAAEKKTVILGLTMTRYAAARRAAEKK